MASTRKDTSAPPAPKRVVLPPQSYDRVKVFGGLLLVVIFCTPVWFMTFNLGELVDSREAHALSMARETWLQKHHSDQKVAGAIPIRFGQPRYNNPPLSVWLHVMAWNDLDPATCTSEQLITRARLLALMMGLVALLSTYWAGMSIGDVRVARLASAALATTLLFVHQIRIASPDTHMLSWCSLAVASGLWAMRPLKEINWVGRRIMGWLLSGLAMSAAMLTAGPLAAGLFILPPLFATILLTVRRRVDNSLGLIFACMLGVVAASPWYLYVLQKNSDALGGFFITALPPESLFALTSSVWVLLIYWCPWTVWLLGALFQPFLRADRARRRQLLIVWFWFLFLFAITSIPAATFSHYLAPLLPAAALLIGQLWAYHVQLASERQIDTGVDLLRIPHWLVLLSVSIFGPLLLIYQDRLVARGFLDSPLLENPNTTTLYMLSAILLLAAVMGARWHFKWKPRLAAYATAGWMIAALAVCLPLYERTELRTYEYRTDVNALLFAVANRPLVFYAPTGTSASDDHAFWFYLGTKVSIEDATELQQIVQDNPRITVICRASDSNDQFLRTMGFRWILEFENHEGKHHLYDWP